MSASYLHGIVDIYNTDDLEKYKDKSISREEVRAVNNLQVELDTGSLFVVLTPEHLLKLSPKLQRPAWLTPVTPSFPTMTEVVGPITVVMGNTLAEVSAYALPNATRTLIGLQVAALLKLQIDWENYQFYLPTAQTDESTMTDDEERKP